MNKHKGCEKEFIQLSKSWYGKACLDGNDIIDQVTVGFFHQEGSTTGEFQITWKELGGKIVPKLEAYDDGWDALFNFGEMLEFMAKVDDKNISADEFCELLSKSGIKNATPTKEGRR